MLVDGSAGIGIQNGYDSFPYNMGHGRKSVDVWPQDVELPGWGCRKVEKGPLQAAVRRR